MAPFMYLLAVAATLGAAFAISEEDISAPARGWVRNRGWTWLPDDETFISPDGGRWVPNPRARHWRFLWELLDCPYCTGFWCAGFATLVVAGHPTTWLWFLTWWAVWGGHIATTAVVQKLR